ncbi:aminopeptidase Q [Drosophila teissieri]|uniref:aminopeptidase Q n=1 Tax=Drosophila teissieri TaxID=7243 RepID=UPI001CBA2737|nr:aminopeptidase Q [Drosophila teissieri]
MLPKILVLFCTFLPGNIAESSVKPLRYNLTILTRLDSGGARNQFEGIVSIDIEATKSTRFINLNSRDLNIFRKKTWLLRWASGRKIRALELKKNVKEPSVVKLVMELPLKFGETYTLNMFFSGDLDRQQEYGYFAGHYDKTPKVFYSMTHLEPDYAPNAFPCFNDPLFRTPYNITMVHDRKYVALSNMPPIKETPYDEIKNYVSTTFMGSPPLAAHQVMWILHSLQKVYSGSTAAGENITIWSLPHLAESLAEVAEVTPNLFSKYETLFAHPLPKGPDWGGKLDHVVVPRYTEMFSGQGLMVYGEDKVDSGLNGLESLQKTLAELVARQWNGLLVSPSDLNEMYVRDGVNYYLSIHVMGMEKEAYNMTQLLRTRLDVLYSDSLGKEKSIATDVREAGNLKFRKNKMCLLTHMIKVAIGDKLFLKGLQEFIQRYANSSALSMELWEEFQREARRNHQLPIGVSLPTVMETWLKQPGFPLLTVQQDDAKQKVTIRQSRYNQKKLNISSKDCWWVPVVYIAKNLPLSQVEWLGCQRKKADILELKHIVNPEDWLLLNVDAAAPLRVLYDSYSLQLISKALLEDFTQIPELSRVQLVDDALSFAWTSLLTYNATLNVISYLSKETSAAVWETALFHLENLQSIMRLTTGYRIFKLFMQKLIEPAFKATLKSLPPQTPKARTSLETSTLTLSSETPTSTISPETPTSIISPDVPETPTPTRSPETTKSESKTDLSLSTLLYRPACQFEIKECLTDAEQRFQSAMEQKSSSSIPEEIRETVLCRGIRNALEDHWIMVRDMYFEAENEKEKRILLNSLSCTTEYWAMQKLLSWALDPKKVPSTLTAGLLSAVLRSSLGYYVGKQFLIDNTEEILRRKDLKLILSPFINAITTQAEFTDLKTHLHKNLPSSMISSILSLLEPALDRVIWRNSLYFDLLKAIRAHTLKDGSENSSVASP